MSQDYSDVMPVQEMYSPQQGGQLVQPLPNRLAVDDKWQYEVDDVLEKLEHSFKGQVWDKNDGEWKTINGVTPLMTDEGINTIINVLRLRLHKGFYLSNFSKDDINRMAWENRDFIVSWIARNHEKYKIDKSDAVGIVQAVDHNIFAALMKPYNDLERKHRSQITTIARNENINTEASRKKWLGIF